MKLKNVDGIWMANAIQEVSYPEGGHARCFQVEDRSYWFLHRNKIILQSLSNHIKPLSNLGTFLDLGGGNGFVASAIQKSGVETYLVEPGMGCFNAKLRGLKNIYMCGIQDLPQSLNFDIIGMFDVVEHISEPVAFLRSAGVHLKTNGNLMITVPAYNFMFSQEDVIAGHFRRYTLKSLTAELELAGFEVTYSSYFFSILLLPIFVFRTLPFILKKHFGKNDRPLQVNPKSDLVKESFLEKVINSILAIESKFIGKGGRLPFGSSILVVARKK